MTVADKKRTWFNDRRAELHARGLNDARIAEQMGYKPAYFSQIANSATIGDGFIDKMCSAFGFRFTISDGDKQSTKPELDESRAAILERIAKAQEEQGVLLQTLTKLILAKLDK